MTVGFIEETKRVYGIFESRLTDRDWLVGPGKGVYTIADMNAIPWIEWHANCGIDSIDEWPNIKVIKAAILPWKLYH